MCRKKESAIKRNMKVFDSMEEARLTLTFPIAGTSSFIGFVICGE
jgi:hypothetical protein